MTRYQIAMEESQETWINLTALVNLSKLSLNINFMQNIPLLNEE